MALVWRHNVGAEWRRSEKAWRAWPFLSDSMCEGFWQPAFRRSIQGMNRVKGVHLTPVHEGNARENYAQRTFCLRKRKLVCLCACIALFWCKQLRERNAQKRTWRTFHKQLCRISLCLRVRPCVRVLFFPKRLHFASPFPLQTPNRAHKTHFACYACVCVSVCVCVFVCLYVCCSLIITISTN